MKKSLIRISFILLSILTQVEALSDIILEKDNGGYVDGTAWDSTILRDKTTLLMYVDPDEKAKGDILNETIDTLERDLDFNKFQILMIVNLNATWKPNALIKSLMKSKAKDNPKRAYIVDAKSILVKKWGLIDDEYNTLVIDQSSKVIYAHYGVWNTNQISELNRVVRENIK